MQHNSKSSLIPMKVNFKVHFVQPQQQSLQQLNLQIDHGWYLQQALFCIF